jgi:hypothetical protein
MPERLSAVSSVLARWSLGVSPSDQKKGRIKADRAVRDARRQASNAAVGGGIAVLPLYGLITRDGPLIVANLITLVPAVVVLERTWQARLLQQKRLRLGQER